MGFNKFISIEPLAPNTDFSAFTSITFPMNCGYQADYRNPAAALRESELDEAEGADILMVKPSLFYLDVIAEIKQQSSLPLAAYNVSGEYSMLIASAERGWGDLKSLVRESIFALNRAGTDIFISYWANQYNKFLKD